MITDGATCSSFSARLADARLAARNDPLSQRHLKGFLGLVSGPNGQRQAPRSFPRAGPARTGFTFGVFLHLFLFLYF